MQTYHWSFSLEKSYISVHSDASIYMDNIEMWITDLIAVYELDPVELNVGADRVQQSFNWQNFRFLLCFEANCEATWIEVFCATKPDKLTNLYHYLSQKVDIKC